ncbi:hypothetical protein ACIPJS_33045 [Streptomyces sp. NPDC086783]|uniref:COG1470 family protein n=1 Tax=Streptomyces sp. NPDC086783 TaxID=3365758 RepID=UPI0037F32371
MPYAPSAVRVLCLAGLLLAAAAPRAAAGDGWSVAPSAGTPQGRPYVYAEGEPGTVLQDSVSVRNPGGGPVTVRLRGATTDGTDGTGGARAREAGAWIGFAGTRGGRQVPVGAVSVRVPAHTRAEVPFTVSVPADAAPGDRTGTIRATGGGRSSAVRIRLRVGGPALSALTVEHVAVRPGRISYELVNRGTTVLTPRLAVHADGLLGALLDRPPRTLPVELPPGRRITLSEPWTGTPALDAVEVRLTVTARGGARGTASASARFVPWRAVGAAAGALAVVAALVAVRRRRGRTADGAPQEARREAELTGAVT